MAKFDELYPDAKSGCEIEFEGSPVVKFDLELPCWHCQSPTLWHDLSFDAPLCSEECERAKWQEYMDAFSRISTKVTQIVKAFRRFSDASRDLSIALADWYKSLPDEIKENYG